MKDENFYKSYFEDTLQVKTITAQVNYTISPQKSGDKKITREVVLVYKYNETEITNLPIDKKIETFPLSVTKVDDKNIKIILKNKKEPKQLSIQL